MFLFKGLEYLWMLVFIMIVSGIAKDRNLFVSAYAYIQTVFNNNKVVLSLVSAISGVLPIEGRVTVSAGVLDTISSAKPHSRQKMGVVDYLSTHHYYLWSPLEKTVILPIAAFGLTYTSWIGIVWPLIVVTLMFVASYIYFCVDAEDVVINAPPTCDISQVIRNVLPFIVAVGVYIYVGGDKHVAAIFGSLALYYCTITKTWNWRQLLNYINWQVLITVAVAIVLGNYFKSWEPQFRELVSGGMFDINTMIGFGVLSTIGFVASFTMGSSGKYVAFAVLMSQLFGVEWFIWFFTVDYVGYILSPTHKCVMVGNRYFGTPFKMYYTALASWCVLLLGVAGVCLLLSMWHPT